MVATTDESMLKVKDMPDYVYQRVVKGQEIDGTESLQLFYQPFDFSNGNPIDLQQYLEEQERELIMAALDQSKGNKSRASKLLGIPRPTLLYKMEKLSIK